MTLDEARAILAAQDTSDLARALQAVAMVLRHNGIAEARLLPIAESIEVVANSVDRALHEAAKGA